MTGLNFDRLFVLNTVSTRSNTAISDRRPSRGYRSAPSLALALLAATALLHPATVRATPFTWNGLGGNTSWTDDDNWNPIGNPNDAANDTATIGNGFDVNVNVSRSANSVSVGTGSDLTINNGQTLTVGGGGVSNDGTIELGSIGATTTLNFIGPQTLGGSGSVDLSNGFERIVINNNVLTHGAGHTIQGRGNVLANTGGMVNEGSILANVDGQELFIDPNGLGFTNQGTMQALNGGVLDLSAGGTFTNTGQTIEVVQGRLDINNNVNLVGGTLMAHAGQEIRVASATLDGVTTEGQVNVQNGNTAAVTNGLTNNGVWELGSIGATTTVQFIGSQTLGGTGSFDLSNGFERIITNNTVLTHGADHTIQGDGQVLANTGGMINHGTLLANINARQLIIDPNGLGFTNQGTIQALNGGILDIVGGGTFTNTGQTIEVVQGRLDLNNSVDMVGGTLMAHAGQEIHVSSATLNGVTTEGQVNVLNGSTATVTNGLTNNGVWELGSIGATTTVQFIGSQTLGGNGSFDLSNGFERIITNNSTLTLGSNQTIQGDGQVLANTGGMINDGTILANVNARQLIIDANGLGFTNQGTIQALNGGILDIVDGGTFDNTGQTIEIVEGRLDINNGVNMLGGTLMAHAGQEIRISSAMLNGVTTEGQVNVLNGTTVQISNGLTNNGTWELGSLGATTTVQFNGDQTLGGSGTMLLNTTSERIITNNTTLTNGANHTIQGNGNVLSNSGGLVNEGTILADATGALIIDPNALGFVNRGTVQVTGSGGLDFIGTYVQDAGLTNVNTLLDVSQNVSIEGGVLSGNGTVRVNNGNGTVTVSDGGTIAAGNTPGTLIIDGDFVQTATGATEIELFGFVMGVDYDFFDITGEASLAGALDIILNSSLALALNIGDEFEVMAAADGITGFYDALSVNFAGFAFDQEVRGNSLFLVTTALGQIDPPSDVPEPATLTLLGLPLAGLWVARRRRQRISAA